jgi:hypothetical protein
MLRTRRPNPARLAALVVVAAALACNNAGPGSGGELTPQQTLGRAADRMSELQSFSFVMEHENGFTTIVTPMAQMPMERAEGAVSGGDRLRADVRARMGPLAANISLVILPTGSWMTNPLTQQWAPAALGMDQFFDPVTGIPGLIRDLKDPSYGPVEPVAGTNTQVVQATIESGQLASLAPAATPGRTLQVKLWVGTDDPVVHRIDILGQLEDTDRPEVVRRLLLSNFNGNVVIEAPN